MNPPPTTNELEALLGSRDFLRKLARGLVLDEQRAEDLVQDACVRALEEPPRHVGAARRWMARVMANLASNQRAREIARPAVERRAARCESVSAEEERDLELQGAVLDAVRALRQPYRGAIYLRYYRGLGNHAIARELGVPVATVKTRLRRGLELLREDLDRRHGGDRRHWCAALLVLALPELVSTTAAPISAGTLAQGIALMNKPLTAALAGAALVAVVTVAWQVAAPNAPAEPESRAAVALAPEAGADPADAVDETSVQKPPSAADERNQRALAAAEIEQPAASATAPGLVGRVIDETGRPVPGARVTSALGEFGFLAIGLGAPEEAAADEGALTDARGTFLLPIAEDGPLSIVVSAAGYAPFRKEATGYYDLRTDVGDLVLATGVRLAGRVVDAGGGPIAGAEISTSAELQSGNVIVFGGGGGEVVAVSGADGSFEVDRQAVGAWSLVARSDAHPPGRATGETVRAGERVSEIQIVCPESARLSGKLSGMPAGARPPLWVHAGRTEEDEESRTPGLRIFGDEDSFLTERTTQVRADGSFELLGLEAGMEYALRAYDGETGFGERAYSQRVTAMAGASGVELPWSTGAAIKLQVIDALTGLPVERFDVEAGIGFPTPWERDGEALREHPEGRVVVDGLRVGGKSESASAILRITAAGYAPFEREDVTVAKDRELDLGVVRLDPVPRVRVRVIDPDGRAVAGAEVTLTDAPEQTPGGTQRTVQRSLRIGAGARFSSHAGAGRSGRTDEAGEVVLSSLPGERAVLGVEARRFAPFESDPIDLPAREDFVRTIVLARGAVAEVLVLDEAGEPLPGARVEHRVMEDEGGLGIPDFGFSGATRVTDSEGRVYYRNLQAGTHGFRLDDGEGGSFVMSGPTHGRAVASIAMGDGGGAPFTELELGEGETRTVTLSTGTKTVLDGYVTEAGEPLAGAELSLASDAAPAMPGMESGPKARTDERGYYSFEDVDPGEYELVVAHSTRAMPHRQKVELHTGSDRIDVALDVATVEGRITDGDGRPVAGARVRAERVSQGGPSRRASFVMITRSSGGGADLVVGGGDGIEPAETDAEGRYVLRGLPADTSLRVRAEGTDFSPARSEPFELDENEHRTDVDLELRAGGSIAVEVFHADGSPAPDALVRLSKPGAEEPGPPRIMLSDDDGRVRFADLEPGRYEVSANPISSPGSSNTSREVEVLAGETSPVRVDLP